MKCLIIALAVLFSFNSFSYDRAVGIALGNPSGLNGQLRLEGNRWLAATAGWELARGRPDILANCLIKEKDRFYLQAYDMDLYYGAGAKLKDSLGANALIGAAHDIEGQRLELFGNAAGSVFIFEDGDLELDLFVGARYLF